MRIRRRKQQGGERWELMELNRVELVLHRDGGDYYLTAGDGFKLTTLRAEQLRPAALLLARVAGLEVQNG